MQPGNIKFNYLLHVRHLLCHMGGWSEAEPGRAMDWVQSDGATLAELRKTNPSRKYPVTTDEVMSYVAGIDPQPGDDVPGNAGEVTVEVKPGTRVSYSNYGFMLLSEIVATIVSAQMSFGGIKTYEEYVRQKIFGILGVPILATKRTGLSNNALPTSRLQWEVDYHSAAPYVLRTPLLAAMPWTRGEWGTPFHRDAGAGAWAMCAADYARVLASFDLGAANPLFDNPALASKMFTLVNPNVPQGGASTNSATLGWWQFELPKAYCPPGLCEIWQKVLVKTVHHNGAYVGTSALAFRRNDGLSMVLLFNGNVPVGYDPSGVLRGAELDISLHGKKLNDIANKITYFGGWQDAEDLFNEVGIPSF